MIGTPGPFDCRRKVHLVGAGGIGVSALAQALLHRGHRVSGSDRTESAKIGKLRGMGATMLVGHKKENVPLDTELLVATAAAQPGNPEIRVAEERGIRVLKYAEALGALMGGEYGLAVAGCHGKTTTTGLLTTVMVRGNMDPTMVLGGDSESLGGNFRPGGGRFFVAEACEFDRSFLSLTPTAALVTNIDLDHLDYYRDLDEIAGAFQDFARLLPEHGFLAVLNEDERIFNAEGIRARVETFGLGDNADWVATDVNHRDGFTRFRVRHHGRDMGSFELRLRGLHNVLNSMGVLALAHFLEIDFDEAVRPALREYGGVDRRMQTRYEGNNVIVLDDYAHHPSEVAAVLSALREEYTGRRIVAVLQPHQASRTRRNLGAFAEALKLADRVFVPDIFFARDSEQERASVHAVDLVRAANNRGVHATYVSRLEDVAPAVLREGARCQAHRSWCPPGFRAEG